MKKRIIFALLMSSMILTSCASKEMSDMSTATNEAEIAYDSYYEGQTDDAYYEYTADFKSEGEVNSSETVHATSTKESDNSSLSSTEIKRDMLVYSCRMSVDVLKFDEALQSYRQIMDKYEGFIETENFNDGGNTSRWYDSEREKWNTYTATVRVPSKSYDAFCSEVSELGDLRNKNASVENVSTEYTDLSTTLKIYEKKEERYISMLADIKDEAQAVIVEDKLTQIQIEIAKIKTRMNQIKTDVAYSYVYVTINEVKEYTAEPVKTDTFGQRFVKTLKDTGRGFLNFLEDLLFFIINILPYALLIGGVVYVFARIVKAIKKVREKRNRKEYETRIKKENASKEENQASEEKQS